MKSLVTYLVLASFLIISCQKILFNDDERSREIILKDFHAVKFSGIYNIVLIQDSTNRLVITGKNDINSIDAVLNGDTLIIDNHKKISFNPEKNTLALHFSNLEYMVTYDPVNISNTDTLKADQFIYSAIGEIAEVRLVVDCNFLLVVNNINTLGYFYLNGKADNCWLYNYYGSSMFAGSLSCKKAEIINESVGDVFINASEYLKASIRGKGNIFYYGTPVIEIAEKRNTGNLIRVN